MSKSSALFWLISAVMVITTAVLAFMNLEEWYEISILRNTSGYPFGGEGPTPYYYKTPELYALITLVWGLLFTGTFAFAVITIIKRNKKSMVAAFVTTLLLLVTMFVQGMIE